jgi:hypothetical protein
MEHFFLALVARLCRRLFSLATSFLSELIGGSGFTFIAGGKLLRLASETKQ